MKLLLPVCLLFACATYPLLGAPIISEIMPANVSATDRDEDGTASDWIEIYNPDPVPVNLASWCLTDNSSIRAKWTFPEVTLPPGGFLRVWCSGKDRKTDSAKLHSNFQLSENGEYLALCGPGGSTVASEFAPGYPAIPEGESYGLRFEAETLVGAKATAKILIPKDDALGLDWTQSSYVPGAGWSDASTNVGFGMMSPGFAIQERLSSVPLTSIEGAEALLNGQNATDNLVGHRPLLNLYGSGTTDGRFGNGLPTLHGGDQSNYALRAIGSLIIPRSGAWTFAVGSDEGFRLKIDGSLVSEFVGTRQPDDTLATVNLTAGAHNLELTYFEATGGDEVELSAAEGSHGSFSRLFKLVGDTASRGLAILTSATAEGEFGQVATDLAASMKGATSAYLRLPFNVANPGTIESLTMRLAFNDGFIAYLNGVEVARRNAPSTAQATSTATTARNMLESIAPETIELGGFRSSIRAGANVLAIHGLNSAAQDESFYLAPTLDRASRLNNAPAYFRKPTPGMPNISEAYLGRVADTRFSVKRSFQTAPFGLKITSETEGVEIRYTTNGSTPTATNGEIYTGPITIDKSTVVRAAAFREGYEPTNVDTNTYLFLDDVIRQGNTPTYGSKPATEWPNSGTVAGQIINYGMDPSIVDNASPAIGGPDQVKAALSALPTLCLTSDLPNLFHATTGIYTHPDRHGSKWERPASLEMINDPNTPEGGFHIPCGIRIRGGYSRSSGNPKHSFRFFFREEYGPTTLRYPIYGAAGATEYDAFDVQCSQNYSWSFEGSADHNALRELWSRDTQLDLGQPSTRGRFVHLYLNGVYWGLFQIQERAEAAFGATYLSGDKDNFDVIKHTGASGGYTTEATDGYFVSLPSGAGDAAWKQLWTSSRACYFINTNKDPANPRNELISTTQQKVAAYYKLMGLQADGKTPSGDPVLLDVDNLIDYIMIIFFAKNGDAPLTGGGTNPNNFYSMRDRTGSRGFIHIQHDGEHSLNAGGASDRWGPFTNAVTGNWNKINFSNPQYTHQDLAVSVEYKIRFADHIYRACFHGGPLTLEQNQARLDKRAAQVESGIIGESARWGDSKTKPARNANNWRTARTATRNWFNTRTSQFLSQAKQKGLFPATMPPDFNQRGGHVASGFSVVLTDPNVSGGIIYYTTDGSDPRPIGGGELSAITAPIYSAPIPLSAPTIIRTRVLNGAEWSPLNEATFFVDGVSASAANLVISEFSYNPLPAHNAEESKYAASDFEFIELLNISKQNVDLSGVKFVGALNYAFAGSPAQLSLPGGGRMILAANPAAFAIRYGTDIKAVGPYSGSLANAGETIRLVADGGAIIKEFTYNDKNPWPSGADGEGFSLVLLNPASNPDHGNAANWRSSINRTGGNPGAAKGTNYAEWAKANKVTDPFADTDGDGLAALAEYAFGTSLAQRDNGALLRAKIQAFTVAGVSANYLTITYRRALAADDLSYVLESSANLSAPWSPIERVLISQSSHEDGTDTVSYRLSQPVVSGGKQFLRLRVEAQP